MKNVILPSPSPYNNISLGHKYGVQILFFEFEVRKLKREGKKRKERSDKKVDVKPTIPIHLFNCISDLSYCMDNKPIKDVVETICAEGMESKMVIQHLSKNFKRGYTMGTTVFMGNSELGHSRYLIRKDIIKKRISTRFTRDFYERINALSNSLDCTPSTTTGMLLEASVMDITIIDRMIKPYTEKMDKHQRRTLKTVIKYLRKDNPFIQEVEFMDVVKYLVEWLKDN